MENCPFLGGVDSLGAGLLPLDSQKEGLPFRNFHVVFPVLALLGKPLSDLREQCVWEGVCLVALLSIESVKPCVQGAQRAAKSLAKEGHWDLGRCGGGVLPHDGLPPPSLSGLV